MSLIEDLIQRVKDIQKQIDERESARRQERLQKSFLATKYNLDDIFVARLINYNKLQANNKNDNEEVVIEYIYDDVYMDIATGRFYENAKTKVALSKNETYIMDIKPIYEECKDVLATYQIKDNRLTGKAIQKVLELKHQQHASTKTMEG